MNSTAGEAALPRALGYSGPFLAVPTVLLVACDLYSKTWAVWGGWISLDWGTLGHWMPIRALVLFAGYSLMALWVVVVMVWMFFAVLRAGRVPKRTLIRVLGAGILVALPAAPPAIIESPFVLVMGPGPHPEFFLERAGEAGSRTLVRVLLARGVDINAVTPTYNFNLLFVAVLDQDPPFIRWLIEHGANVNQRSTFGATPLFNAIGRSFEHVEVLLHAGADPTVRDNQGRSILDEAIATGDPRIIEAVREALRGRDAQPAVVPHAATGGSRLESSGLTGELF